MISSFLHFLLVETLLLLSLFVIPKSSFNESLKSRTHPNEEERTNAVGSDDDVALLLFRILREADLFVTAGRVLAVTVSTERDKNIRASKILYIIINKLFYVQNDSSSDFQI